MNQVVILFGSRLLLKEQGSSTMDPLGLLEREITCSQPYFLETTFVNKKSTFRMICKLCASHLHLVSNHGDNCKRPIPIVWYCIAWEPAGDDGDVIVSLQVIRIGSATFARCEADDDCTFSHRWRWTPVVYRHSLGGHAQTFFTFSGNRFSDHVENYSGEVGGMKCDFQKGTVRQSGLIECLVLGGQLGRHNTTIRVDHDSNGKGEPHFGRWAGQVGLDGIPFHYTLHPHIESVSNNAGGVNGGARITLKTYGFSFNEEENEVFLGGSPCKVISVEAQEDEHDPQIVTCLTGNATASSETKRPPGRGMSVKIFSESTSDIEYYMSKDATPNQYALQTGDFSGAFSMSASDAGSDRTELIEGIFIAPKSTYYTWYVLGRGYNDIWISMNNSHTELPEYPVAKSTFTTSRFDESPDQKSEPIWMEAGTRHYVASLHANDRGLDRHRVGLRIHGAASGNYHLERDQSVYEVQEWDIVTNKSYEQQEILLQGVQNGTFMLYRQAGPVCSNFIVDLGESQSSIEDKASTYAERLTSSSPGQQCGSDGSPLCDTVDVHLRKLEDENGFSGYSLLFTFQCATEREFPLLLVEYERRGNLNNIPGRSISVIDENRIQWASSPVRGSYLLCLEDECSDDIPYDAGSSTVESILESMTNIDDVDVFVESSDSDFGRRYRVRFFRPFGDVDSLRPDAFKLQGEDVRINVRTIEEGNSEDVFYETTPMDWFEFPETSDGSVRAEVKGMLSSCNVFSDGKGDGCVWTYMSELTPQIHSVDPNEAVVGEQLTISGEGFLPEPQANDVHIGEGSCNVTSASESELVCILQDTNAGTHSVEVVVGEGRGKASNEQNAAVTINMNIFDISVLEGSLAGGTEVNITGTGFSVVNYASSNEVLAELDDGDRRPFKIIDSSHRMLQVRTPSVLDKEMDVVEAVIRVNGIEFSDKFQFKESLTWKVQSMSPERMSPATSGIMEFKLVNMKYGKEMPIEVMIGDRPCQQPTLNASTGTLRCALIRGGPPPLPQDPVAPLVHIATLGYADVDNHVIDVGYRVTGLSIDRGSILGGQRLKISGVGFGNEKERIEVRIHLDTDIGDWVVCEATSVVDNIIECTTPSIEDYMEGRNTTMASIEVRRSRMAAPCDGLSACQLVFAKEFTPKCRMMHSENSPNEVLQLMGESLLLNESRVYIGEELCAINPNFSDAGNLECILPYNRAGRLPIHVDTDYGIADCPFYVEYSLVVNAISATEGSMLGGHPVTFVGQGFSKVSKENVVFFDGHQAEILESSYTRITAFTPKSMDEVDKTVDVLVRVNVSHHENEHEGDGHDDEADDGHHHHGRALEVAYNDTYARESPTPFPSSSPSSSVSPSVSSRPTSLERLRASLPASYTYKTSLTHEANVVSDLEATHGDILALKGDFPAEMKSGSYISIGDVDCEILSWNSTYVMCEIGSTPAGTFSIELVVGDRGFVDISESLTIPLSISNVLPSTGSVAGGQNIEIFGTGFPELSDMQNPPSELTNGSTREAACEDPVPVVEICKRQCQLKQVGTDKIICTSGGLATREALDMFSHYSPKTIEWNTLFGSEDDVSTAFDKDVSTDFWASDSSCHMGIDVGDGVQAVVTQIKFFPTFRQKDRMLGGKFEGSNDSVTWSVVAEIDEVVEGWNTINLGDLSSEQDGYRFLQYVGPGDSHCEVSELEFVGRTVAVDDNCDVTVKVSCSSNNQVTSRRPNAFQYDAKLTPVIDTVSPPNGTSTGGTEVTITGFGFSSNSDDITVRFNGVDCEVSASSETSVSCVTGPRDVIRPLSIDLYVMGKGYAVYNSTSSFRYLDRWSNPATWNFEDYPGFNDSVHIPEGQSVLLDQSTPVLYLLLIEGELIFDNMDLSLDANYILIDGGRFQVGTEEEPFSHNAVITLHGDRWDSVEVPGVGAKVLAVFDKGGVIRHGGSFTPSFDEIGYLDLHGRPRRRTWTKLGETIQSGDSEIRTAEDVDFEPGETIVVTSSGRNFRHTEEVEIESLCDPPTRCLRIAGTFKHWHGAEMYEEALEYGHSVVDMRAEVALLHRNIVIQGDDKSAEQVFGAHTVAFHGGHYRIENTELRLCGQGGRLGRYCTHGHMTGDFSQSYVKSNSIHKGLQRAVTIHATERFTVSHNFAYKIKGHTIFFEDGVEKFNLVEENLVVWSLPLSMGILSDTSPANFWMAGPKDFIRHNVAAGAVNYGFWFEMPGRPHGPSAHRDITPNREDLGEFFNNTAHSNDAHGLRIYPTYIPRRRQTFYNTTSFRNGGDGQFGYQNGILIQHKYAKYVENSGNNVFWRFLPAGAPIDQPNLLDCIFVANIDPKGSPIGSRGIFAPEDEFFYVSGATFVNYQEKGVISGCNGCPGEKQGGNTFRFERLAFYNSDKRTSWTAPFKQIFFDLDGTLTGYVNGTTTPHYKFHENSHCWKDEDGKFDGGTVCDGSVRVRKFQVDGHSPRELNWQSFVFHPMNQPEYSDVIEYMRGKDVVGWVATLVTSQWYEASVDTLVDWRSFRFRYGEPAYIMMDAGMISEWVGLELSWIDFRWKNKVTYAPGSSASTEVTPLEAPHGPDRPPLPSDPIGTGWIERGPGLDNDTWRVIINDIDATASGRFDRHRISVENIQCPPEDLDVAWKPEQCELPPHRDGDFFLFNWTDPDAWEDGKVPKGGEDAVIRYDRHIQLNIETPLLNQVSVEGKLSFFEGTTLNAKNMIVWNELVMGTPESPLEKASIRIYGDRFDDAIFVGNHLFLGNKVIAVMGSMTVAGQPKTPWTRLNETATAGSRTLRLDETPQGWNIGDNLVLTSTEYDSDQQETVTISDVTGTTVTLVEELKFSHKVTHMYGEKFAAAVGNLNRSVSIEGVISEEDAESGETGFANYGVHLVASETFLQDENGDEVHRRGSVNFDSVEFFQCGKQALEHGCFLFTYPISRTVSSRNVIQGSAFSHSFNNAIVAEDFGGEMNITGNVIHRTFRSAIDFWDGTSDGAVIKNNLLAGVFRPPDATTRALIPIAGIFMDGEPIEISGNYIASADGAGLTYRPPTCGHDNVVTNNEIVGSRIGEFVLRESGDCRMVSGVKAYKITHVGILTVDQTANLIVDRSIVADSHIGISLNFIRGGTRNFANVTNSVILGSTVMSDCSGSLSCQAASSGDLEANQCGSVFGSSYRRIGVVTSQYTSTGKTCEMSPRFDCQNDPPNTPASLCSLPWEERHGVPSAVEADLNIDNVVFGNFKEDDCGMKSVAVAHNPSQFEFVPRVQFSRIQWIDVDRSVKFLFTESMCTGGNCQGYMYILFRDLDGTMHGSANGSLIYNNPPLSLPSPYCQSETDYLGIWCPESKYERMLFQPGGRTNQNLSPLLASHNSDIDFNNINQDDDRIYSAEGSFMDSCAMASLDNWLMFSVLPDRQHSLKLFNTMPAQVEFTFISRDVDDRFVIRMFVQRPNKIDIYYNGEYVESQRVIPTKDEPPGSNHFNPQLRHVWFTVHGHPDLARIAVIRTPDIQVNIDLVLSPQQFWTGEGQRRLIYNLALLLSIPESRLRVVDRTEDVFEDLRILSEDITKLSLFIEPKERLRFREDEVTNGRQLELSTSLVENYDEIVEQQKNISQQIQRLSESGVLQRTIVNSTNATAVTGIETIEPSSETFVAETEEETDDDDEFSSSSLGSAVIAAIVGIAAAGIGVLVVYSALVWRKKRKHRRLRVTTKFGDLASAPRGSVVEPLKDSRESSSSGSRPSPRLESPASVNARRSSGGKLSQGSARRVAVDPVPEQKKYRISFRPTQG